MTNDERISNGECISSRGVDHCPRCTDSCDAAHFKFALQDLLQPSPVKYVKQEERFGCAIAVLAMILNKTYSEVKDLLPTNRGYGDKNGMTNHDYISFLYLYGFVGMTIYACESHTQIKREKSEWIKPIAPINIVSVINEHGPHAILWTDNKIYDPNDLRVYLKIEDYDVQGITGFWKLNSRGGGI